MNKTKKYLFIIDPQNDFIEGGSLAVPGGKEALQRIVDSGILDREDWDEIIVTLDSHNPGHIGFGEPETELRKYLLKDVPPPTPWPPHCIIDTHGWEIYGPLQEKLISLGDKVTFIGKGFSNFEDSYAIPVDTNRDMVNILLDIYWSKDDREIYWTGLAEDYCVYESIKVFMKETEDNAFGIEIKNTLLSDMTACITKHIDDENISITPYRS